MKNLESSIQNILNEEYIEENINKIKDLYVNQSVIDSIKKGDRVEIATEKIQLTGKPYTKISMFIVDDVVFKDSMTRIEFEGKSYGLSSTLHYDRRRGMVAFTLGDNRLVISGIRKK